MIPALFQPFNAFKPSITAGCIAALGMAIFAASAQAQAVGVVRAERSAEISAPLTAVLLELPVQLGDTVEKGDLLARFECTEAQGALDISKAEAKATELELKIQQEAKRYGRGSPADLARAEAKHTLAEARITADQAIVEKCTIFAPFTGQITHKQAVEYERQQIGDLLVELTDATKAYVEIRMPSLWLENVELGQTLVFIPEQRQGEFGLRIARIGRIIDEVSQTIKVEAEMTDETSNVWIGESGTVLRPEQQ